MNRADIKQRIEAVEESYEFFLAYAAQGVTKEASSKSGAQLRIFLDKMDNALTGLADGFRSIIHDEDLSPRSAYDTLVEVLSNDARATQAAVQVVRSRPSVSSQMIDNFNASIHVRALLTDLFLLDEVLG